MNNTGAYELVYEGIVDDSTAVFRRVKGAFVADLEFDACDVREIIEKAPISLMKCTNQTGLKAPYKILSKAGAKVSIRPVKKKKPKCKERLEWHTTILSVPSLWENNVEDPADPIVVDLDICCGDSSEKDASSTVSITDNTLAHTNALPNRKDNRKDKRERGDFSGSKLEKPQRVQKPSTGANSLKFDGIESSKARLSPYLFEFGAPLVDVLRCKQMEEEKKRHLEMRLQEARLKIENRRKRRTLRGKISLAVENTVKEIAEQIQPLEIGAMFALTLIVFQLSIWLQ